MNYSMKVLHRTSDFYQYWAERCRFNQEFVPAYSGYYLGQYEIDGFDKHSIHVGIFHDDDKPLGFARITYNTANPPVFAPTLSEEVQQVIGLACGNPALAPLPLWENYEVPNKAIEHFPFYQGGIQTKTAEIGRLMILGENKSVSLATNFVTYILALTKFVGVELALASQTHSHYRFYAKYFDISHSWDLPYLHGDTMCISVFDLQNRLRNKQELMDQILEYFQHKGFQAPIRFESHRIQKVPVLAP